MTEQSNSFTSRIVKPDASAVIVTVCSDAGVGKTSFAATFPKPFFLRVEDGMQSIDSSPMPDTLPIADNADQFFDDLLAFTQSEHDYKTLVIDSVTKLEIMFIDHVVKSDPKKPRSINQALGGYGAGLRAVASMHQRVRKAAEILKVKRGINTVFIAHADTEMMDLPDTEPYMRFNLRLDKRSMQPYVDDVDIVGFIRLHTFLAGDDGSRKQARSDGSRILTTYATPSNISKNRFGITKDLDLPKGVNPLVEFVPALQQD